MLKCDTKSLDLEDSPENSPTKSGGKSSDRKKTKLHEKSPTKKSVDISKINQGPGTQELKSLLEKSLILLVPNYHTL